jgi:ribose/xylose/arabinose/galactoside ABC-type transport system permease subunit
LNIIQRPAYRLMWPGVVFGLYLACIYAIQPAFFSSTNLISVFYYSCLLVPAALAAHLLIVLGLIDLSVGSVAAASGIVTVKAVASGLPLLIALGLGILTGLSFGLLNWLLVGKLGVSALIGTLITMGTARAAAVGVTEGKTLVGLPDEFGELAQGSWVGIPYIAAAGMLLVVVVECLSQRHVVFRRFYQTGSNRIASAACGIDVTKVECIGFFIAGLGASLVGLMQSSRTLSASPFAFPDLALDCIAACVIGGSRLSGGYGRPVGAFLGLMMVVISRNLVVLAGVSVYWQDLAIAVVLFAGVLFSKLQKGD